ncbi:MAG TPA: type II toxin-antitoxin system VapC family toxin [Pararhizobium sp.]|nr:type II toxin-antitoxin system VapC family toxin [Pararhizobium sp.]
MKVTADTNLLVRMAVRDDDAQARIAFGILAKAQTIIVPLPCILELAWVLGSTYKFTNEEIIQALTILIDSENVLTDLTAVETGLRVLRKGGDFADGVIASAGAEMGAEAFVSFDRKAIKCIASIGLPARHAGELA